ncbi:MAG: lytic transglycosylase domain-containing protein [Bdellovibrionales bacterium]|nr:lytic transglycosylase domain-containing protein [Bdellovibrionales bacterium]
MRSAGLVFTLILVTMMVGPERGRSHSWVSPKGRKWAGQSKDAIRREVISLKVSQRLGMNSEAPEMRKELLDQARVYLSAYGRGGSEKARTRFEASCAKADVGASPFCSRIKALQEAKLSEVAIVMPPAPLVPPPLAPAAVVTQPEAAVSDPLTTAIVGDGTGIVDAPPMVDPLSAQLPDLSADITISQASRTVLKKLMEEKRWKEFEGFNDSDFLWISQKMGTADVDAFYQAVMESKECLVPASLMTSVASRLEERLPDIQAQLNVTDLLLKAGECGVEAASARAIYRAALFLIMAENDAAAEKALERLSRMKDISLYSSRLTYWRLYLAQKRNDEERVGVLKLQMEKEHPLTFHALLAREGLVKQFLSGVRAEPEPIMRSSKTPELNPIVRATEALIFLNEKEHAGRFLNLLPSRISGSELGFKVYIASLLSRVGDGLEKFKLLSSVFRDDPSWITSLSLEMFFPIWHLETLRPHSQKRGVDPFLILAIIRQESAFNRFARSSAGARGLLQLMPGTAKDVGRVRASELYNPEVNLRVGVQFFGRLLERFHGNVVHALAGYNAGPLRVNAWAQRYNTTNPVLFTDLIPFRETREYVATILRNYYWYSHLYGAGDANLAGSASRTPASKEGAVPAKSQTFQFLQNLIQAARLGAPGSSEARP